MRYLWIISLFVVIVFGNILYISQDISFFDKQFTTLWSYERQETVMEEAMILMKYRKNTDVLVASDVYMQAEKEHLYDVKKILSAVRYLLVVVIFLLFVLSFLLYRRWFFSDPGSFASPQGYFLAIAHSVLRMTIVWFVLFGLVLFGLSWFAWDWLFDIFHRTFFVDNWLFSADSFLIESYPWEFFRNAMIVVLGRSVWFLAVVSLLFWVVQKKPRRA